MNYYIDRILYFDCLFSIRKTKKQTSLTVISYYFTTSSRNASRRLKSSSLGLPLDLNIINRPLQRANNR